MAGRLVSVRTDTRNEINAERLSNIAEQRVWTACRTFHDASHSFGNVTPGQSGASQRCAATRGDRANVERRWGVFFWNKKALATGSKKLLVATPLSCAVLSCYTGGQLR